MVGIGIWVAGLEGVIGGGSDHGAVIGAELGVREVDLVSAGEAFLELGTEKLVGGDATSKQNGFGWIDFGGFLELLEEDIDSGFLETGGKISDLLLSKVVFELVRRGGNWEIELFLDGAKYGGFDATKGKIEAVNFWDGERVFVRSASCGGLSDGWATGVGQAEDFGNLIEAFANGVIASSADNFEMIMTFHVNNLSMTARDDGGKEWKFWLVATEPVGVDVRFKMMSWIEWFVVDDGQRASGESADKEGTDEARCVGYGDSVDVVNGKVGVFERFIDDGLDGFDMGASGDFRNDASVFGMDIDLRDDNVRQNMGAVCDDGGGGFVAGGFDSQDFH